MSLFDFFKKKNKEKAPLVISHDGEKYISVAQLAQYIRVEAANFDLHKKSKEKVALYALAKMIEELATYSQSGD